MSVDRIHYLGFFHPFPLSQKIIQSKNGGEITSKTEKDKVFSHLPSSQHPRLRSKETISNPSYWQCIEDWQPGTCLNGHVHCKHYRSNRNENMAHVTIASSVPKWIFLENYRKKKLVSSPLNPRDHSITPKSDQTVVFLHQRRQGIWSIAIHSKDAWQSNFMLVHCMLHMMVHSFGGFCCQGAIEGIWRRECEHTKQGHNK